MKRIILLLIICLHIQLLQAAVSTAIGTEKGSAISGAILTVQDDKYDYMLTHAGTWPQEFSNKSAKDRIILKYTGESKKVYTQQWSLTVPFTLKSWTQTGAALPDVTGSLTINYVPGAGAGYKDIDVFSIPNGYKTKLIVGAVTPVAPLTAIPADVILESTIETERYYKLNPNNSVVIDSKKDVYTNTLELKWPFLTGAEEYDVEWVFVSKHRLAKQPVTDPAVEFENASRISTSNNAYKINLIYDDGFIYYRVRGVGRKGSNFTMRQEGKWSGIGKIEYLNYEHKRNWNFDASYTEDGKSKEAISFYDGSGRNRQYVVKLNTENTVLATETMYDFEGRSAIQTLPAPINDFKDENGTTTDHRISKLDFYKQYSLSNTTGLQFSAKDFDNDALVSPTTCKPTSGGGMKNTQGASNYYSRENPEKDKGFNAALPDANLFPFAQTVYDKEGNVKMQSGPGNTHKIGAGHEMQFFNSTVLQPQLDRLFGNDVGNASHYSQKAVMDANGQLTVSYFDLSGKVIASFLTGTNVTKLDDLSETSSVQVEENFNSLNALSSTEDALIVDAKYFVSSLGTYEFTYSITEQQYTSLCTGIENSCVYDLLITIFDECDQPVLDAGNTVIGKKTSISGATTITFNVNFPRVGVYKIRKKLTLNEPWFKHAIELEKTYAPHHCVTPLETLKEEYKQSIEGDCITSCEELCKQAATALYTPQSPEWLAKVEELKKENCTGVPKCGALLDQLARDLSLEGQYFENRYQSNPSNWYQWLEGNVWRDCDDNAWLMANFIAKDGHLIISWQDLKNNWKPEFATQLFSGTQSTNHHCSGPFHFPVVTNAAGHTISNRQRLVEFHPEYCHYQWCVALESSTKFDMDLATISFASATTKPAGAPYLDLNSPPVGKNIIDADPYFSGVGAGDKSLMISYLSDMDGPTNPQPGMWALALELLDCNVGCTPSNDHWEAFRALYLAKKARLVYERKAAATCRYLCDTSNPPDNLEDGCTVDHNNDINTSVTNREIRVPYPNLETMDIEALTAKLESDEYTPQCTPNDPSGPPCITNRHCLCETFENYKLLWNYISPVTGEAYVPRDGNGVQLIPLDLFIAVALNREYGFLGDDPNVPNSDTLTAAIMSSLMINCQNSGNETPYNPNAFGPLSIEEANGSGNDLAKILRCDQVPPDCKEESEIITDFYANAEYDKQIKKTIEEFIAAYKETCLHTGFEDFKVTHAEKNYQYTLYYYDRAGNLEKTVPPEGVRPLNDNETKQAGDYRNQVAGVSAIYPSHQLVSTYRYNSFNELTDRTTPDAGTFHFWYNNAGQLRFSVNGKQVAKSTSINPGPYTYTKYDYQGRVKEVGESDQNPPAVDMGGPFPVFDLGLKVNDANFPTVERTEVTKTYYDSYASEQIRNKFPNQLQKNLRDRVSTVSYQNVGNDNVNIFDHATHYSYDPHGNVNVLLQDNPDLKDIAQDVKKIEYDYDLVSGNVKQVSYQRNAADQFYHRYTYDDDNRVKSIFTSNDGVIWANDAKYYYYLHGPLARMELGDKKVQGLDYAYTIQGWTKAVNGSTINYTQDIGKDGVTGNKYIPSQNDLHKNIARDAFAFGLYYYTNDYEAINTDANHQFIGDLDMIDRVADNVYNGNIKMRTTGLMKINDLGPPTLLPVTIANYRYDQLNRIKNSTYRYADNNQFTNVQVTNEYMNLFTYDGNGNILTQFRNGSIDKGLNMDQLIYQYDYVNGDPAQGLSSNKLLHVNDAVTPTNEYDDIDDQGTYNHADPSTWNYRYDEIGNMIHDKQSGIESIEWTLYGKIKRINRIPGFKKNPGQPNELELGDLEYAYDASGNRIMKKHKSRRDGELRDENYWTSTYYVRDAQGNVMATYERHYSKDPNNSSVFIDEFNTEENTLYSGKRIGTYRNAALSVSWPFSSSIVDHKFTTKSYSTPMVPNLCLDVVCPDRYGRNLGFKQYELSDHLGNVHTVISDNIIPVDDIGSDGIADYTKADLLGITDYYPFGTEMPDRTSGGRGYHYGFNGKENDREVKGEGNQQDYGMRIYDPRLGKFLSVDPLTAQYPELTPYQFASNTPIEAIDLDGLEGWAEHNDLVINAKSLNTTPQELLKKNAIHTGGVANAVVTGTVELGKGVYNLGATFGVGVYNASTVYIPQTFGFDGGKPMEVLTTEGYVEFGGGEHNGITNKSGAAVGEAVVYSVAAELATPVIKYGVGVISAKLLPYIKFGGFGGNVTANAGKTTTILGRFKGGTEHIIASGKFRVGQNTGGFNLLNIKNWSWEKNAQWLAEAIERNDIFRVVSDPRDMKNIWKDGIINGERTTFGQEVEMLETANYKYNPKTSQYEK